MSAIAETVPEETLVIVGVGLIGGSIAAAARARRVVPRILGAGRNAARLEQARIAGFIDGVATAQSDLGDRPLVVICTPVDRIVRDAETWLNQLPSGALVTDAGSTKRRICEALSGWSARQLTFVGSHPIAGSEKQGFEHADAELFAGRTCVVTPLATHGEQVVGRVTQFWQALGMLVVTLSPAEHDRSLGATSHLPHVVAAALAAGLRDSDRELTGTGFADTTRIAAGDPALWTAILRENAADVAEELAAMQRRLSEYERALRTDNAAALQSLLETAKTKRDSLTVMRDDV